MCEFKPTEEQLEVLNNTAKSLVVSASAGSGKTSVLVEYISSLVLEKRTPIKKFLVLTFTNVAADEMKERLLQKLSQARQSKFLFDQIDDLPNADICTIDAFCERVIKKNLDKSGLDQTFSVIDESGALQVKSRAFDQACESFLAGNKNEYWEIFNSFKRNKAAVFDCIQKMQDFLDSSHNAQEILDNIKNNQPQIFEQACQIVEQHAKEDIKKLQIRLNDAKIDATEQKLLDYAQYLETLMQNLLVSSFFDMCQTAQGLKDEILLVPRVKNQPTSIFSAVRTDFKEIVDDLAKFSTDQNDIENQKRGVLSCALVNLYQKYRAFYDALKENDMLLDFADIEIKCAQLLQDQTIRQELQNTYKYVFIDEYQDTNTLQANIIKTIAQICNFVAVGDPKQAIYGFRNASMEIMKGDITDFSQAQDGNVVYLTGNFRSDKRVLDFVNQIFCPLMTNDTVGIDYQKTSMLDGRAPYKTHDEKIVDVCIIEEKNQKSTQKTQKNQVYSLKNDILVQSDKDMLEAEAIVKYVDDLLVSQIYDLKQKKWRAVELSDIVILMRGRSSLMTAVEAMLTKNGYPVIADSKENINDDAEIQVLCNILKICTMRQDEIAWTSVLLSKFGGLTLDEISLLASADQNKTMLEKIFESDHQKIVALRAEIEVFKKESEIFGLREAFERLFVRHDYFAYLKAQGEEKYQKIEKFLSLIVQSGQNFNPNGFLAYIQSNQNSKVVAEGQQNAISILTVHGSKGMEYPIVILAGCGKSLLSPNRTPYILSRKFGLCTCQFDHQNMLKHKTPQFEAAKILKNREEIVDELMIFYVALTRAKNRLILTGNYDFENYNPINDMFDGKCYFDWLFYGQKQEVIDDLRASGAHQSELANFVCVDEVENLQKTERKNIANFEIDQKLKQKIENYLNFDYKNINLSKIEFKNSVTGLLKLQLDKDEKFDFQDANFAKKSQISKNSNFTAAEIGTIYHTALKEIEFEKISTLADTTFALDGLVEKGFLLKDERKVIDDQILFDDLIILKNLTKNKKIFKEKAFMMKLPLCEVFDQAFQDGVLVQGIVDMFALGEENILVDYKFTSIQDENALIEKYKKQIVLYSKAIENAFGIKLQKKYIFSIKNAKLLQIFD